jgi:hypothetical protein
MRKAFLIRALLALGLASVLGACTIVVEPTDVRVSPPTVTIRDVALITQFEPERGRAAVYEIGDPIAFRVRATEDGFVTLTAIDPTGEVYVFARNIPVRAGRTEIIRGISPRQRFVVTGPEGLHRVSAHFKPARSDESIAFWGVRGYTNWQMQIRLELRAFPRGDVVETRFTVRR